MPDRIPLSPGTGRESTLKNWHSQGLPELIVHPEEITEYAYREAGGKEYLPRSGADFPIVHRMIPQFKEKVMEKRDRSLVVQDWKGNICEISDAFGPEYLRNAIDFVTRRWIKCPVETREDWEKMRLRYDFEEPSRFPDNPKEKGELLKDRDWVISFRVHGPFWQLREWLGFETLCTMFYDDPGFLKEMIAFWENYIAQLLEKAFGYIDLDEIYLSEDMAYKKFSMISPEMVRDFLLPTYKRWGEIIKKAGCPIYSMDSDGYIGELIPIWIEAGINRCDPIEVAAGNDICEYRKTFGKTMAFLQGVDKRAIAKGGGIIENEMRRIGPVIQSGGYIPGCDHGIPHDISWENFVLFVKLLAQATGWM